MQVEWVNPADPTKGFKYLFLSPDDYASLMERGAAAGGPAPVKAECLVTEDGEERWQLTGGCGAALRCNAARLRPGAGAGVLGAWLQACALFAQP